jgi:hypothetical protein
MDCARSDCLENKCDTRYRLASCTMKQKHVLSSLNEHEQPEQIQITKKRSLPFSCKETIEQILNEKDIHIPNRIFIEMVNNKDKYHLKYLPNLSQIQNYLKYRRVKIGDVNNIDGVEQYVNQLNEKMLDSLNPEEPIFFGEEFGSGNDDSHFHLGITSKALLDNIHKSEIFHLDATYKIIKYGFPLIVFGVTDIRRQFHLIAFMITSHETQIDFAHFLKHLADLCERLDICLNPKYLVQDADQAMSNAVKSIFNDCTIIMCYFHVKSNVLYLSSILLIDLITNL